MTQDPFGNLQDWGQVLEHLENVFENGGAEDCQRGLIRILRYKGNWRLREETLKGIENIENPKEDLIREVLSILEDDNIYYEARIIACRSLIKILHKNTTAREQLTKEAEQALERIKSIPQPPFFIDSINMYARDLK
ncbi:MAG: hypothetical protein R6V41_00350 [Desulfobacteraceae bacterium]